MKRFIWKTLQIIELSFTIITDKNIKLTNNDIEKLDKKLDDILLDSIEDEVDISTSEFDEGGFYCENEFKANEKVEIYSKIIYKIDIRGKCSNNHYTTYDILNDFEINEKSCISNINKSKLISELSMLPIIGKYIQKDSIFISISKVDINRMQLKDVELL